MSFFSAKTTLRQHYLIARQAIEQTNHKQWSQMCCQQIYEMIDNKAETSPAIIAGYVPIKAEIDTLPALKKLYTLGHTIALPCIAENKKELFFKKWQPNDALMQGMYGTKIPVTDAPQLIPDIIIVPLLAFDRTGHRLGYGGGYYDVSLRILRAQNTDLLTIGAAFSLQEENELPVDSHDERLDAIVTEKEVYEIIGL